MRLPIIFLALSTVALAQTTQTSHGANSPNIANVKGDVGLPAGPPPALSTAEKTAIQALEKQKQDAQKMFTDAQQAESTIEQEFRTSHPGYHLDPQMFAVEKDVAPATPTKTVPASPRKP